MTEDKLEKPQTAALARPSFLKAGDVRGTEHMTKDDLRLPRLGLAQGLSPQLMELDPKYIKGLKIADLFNSLTSEIIGRGPIPFTVVRADPPRGVEFHPLAEGGGIKDFKVPLTDKRMQFGPNGEKPIATKFYDFIILPLPVDADAPMLNMIALSFKGIQLKVARDLNSLLKLRSAPSFACRFILTTAMDKNKLGTFAVYKIQNDGWVDEATFKAAEWVHEQIKERQLAPDLTQHPELDPDAPGAETEM